MDRRIKFREFVLSEVIHITTWDDIRDFPDLPKNTVPLAEIIDKAFEQIVSGNFRYNSDPYDGTVVANGNAMVLYNKQPEVYPVRVAVFHPNIFKGNHPYGQADRFLRLAKIFWDKDKEYGLDSKTGKLYNPAHLYSTITHEVTHLFDKALIKKQQNVEKSDPWYQSDDAEWDRLSTYIEPKKVQQLSQYGQNILTNPNAKQKYLGSKAEKVARRSGYSYELARRIAANHLVNHHSHDYSKDNWRPLQDALADLRRISVNNIKQYLPMSQTLDNYYQLNPEEFNRIIGDTYKHLLAIYNQADTPIFSQSTQ